MACIKKVLSGTYGGHCGRHHKRPGDPSVARALNLDQLRKKLKPILLRRTRQKVIKELPPRTTEVIRIAPTEEQYNPAELIENLSLYAGQKIRPAVDLNVFDEILASDGALKSLKYFYEDASMETKYCP